MRARAPRWLPSRDRRILALALPAIVTLIADPMMGLVDTAIVGRLGARELGGLGLAVAILSAVSWIFNFLVFGTTSTVARAVGAGDRVAAGRRVSHATQVAVVIGIVTGVALWMMAPTLVRALGAVDDLIDPASRYLRIRSIGVPFVLLGFVGHGAFRGVSNTVTPLLVAVAANVVNAVLTYVFVFPLGWGIAGAAWATVLAEAVSVVAFVVLLYQVKLPMRGHGRPNRRQLLALATVSRDLFLRTGGLLLGLLAVSAAAARVDAVTAAAHQVLFQVFMLISFLMDGFAISGQALVGTVLGAGDEQEARATGRALMRWGVGGGLAMALALLAGSSAVPRLLMDDPAVLAAVGGAWWLVAIGQVIAGPVFALDGVLMGAEDFAFLRTWTIVAAVVGGVGAQLVVTAGGGLLGIWLAVQALMLTRLISVLMRLRGGGWARTGAELVNDP